jgi:hypothetical protein
LPSDLLSRLVRRDIRNHLAQAILLVVAIAVATATLTMALALNGVTSHPYAETHAATKGPDVVAYLTSASQAKSLIQASGVTASSGPYPVASATIHFDGRYAGVFAEGRDAASAAVDQPELTAGGWVRPGGIVLERAFADALGVSVGDRVTLNDTSFTVAGIAGAIVGVPLGLALFTTAVKGGSLPSPLWLVATVIGTLVVMAALTIVPARISSMRPIVGALQAEAA